MELKSALKGTALWLGIISTNALAYIFTTAHVSGTMLVPLHDTLALLVIAGVTDVCLGMSLWRMLRRLRH